MGLKRIHTVDEMKAFSEEGRSAGKTICLVPTMGALHEGHLSLIDMANERADLTVVSIFVNPKQFNVSADLAAYPRDEERDCELLRERGVEAVFIPPVEEVYPGGHSSTVQVSGLTEHYEGAGRPGHFEGVATVLTILFLLVRPNSAIFGEKDFQQLRTVEKLVKDLRLDLEIIRGPLIREADGLALSSRNERLSTEGRTRALALSQALRLVRGNYESGSTGREELLAAGRAILEAQEGVRIEYLDVVSEKTLLPLDDASSEPSRVLLAATVEGVRLLDNIALFG